MFNIPALTWTLTAVLLAGGSYHLVQAVRARHLTDRVNNTLHALMNAIMAAMLWNLAPSTILAQIGLLAGAALWFTIQAIARPEFKILCAGTQGRIKCAYHSLTMTAAATMIALMTHPATSTNAAAPGTPIPATHHHTMAAAHNNTATATAAGFGNVPALLLTIFFAAAAATFLTLLLRRHRTTTHHHTTGKHTTRTEHALEALGATTMALMFATMTA